MKTSINTRTYGTTYGRNPQPNQLGRWAFSLPGKSDTPFFFTGKFSTAVKEAKRFFSGAASIDVLT